MPKNRRKRRSLQEISELISELKSTQITAAELAKREGVSTGAVYQWKKKVSDLSAQPAPEPIEVIAAPTDWPHPSDSGVSLILSERIGCKLEPGFDSETLIRVIKTVNQANS